MDEGHLLDRFKADPSPESLRGLLLAHERRIYNACFQVLARAEDAEDAAQEVLLKLAEGARTVRDADTYRGWIYRVSLRAALDLWRRREATKARESRAAMNRPLSPPLDDRERIALFEAMDGLDDTERSLLLEHYFEKIPLPVPGDRRGVSAVAIWKRIDRAREKLKKSLLGAGFVVASSTFVSALEAAVPAPLATSMATEAVVSKVLAGGLTVVGSKVLGPAVVVGVFLLLAIGVGGASIYRSRRVAETSKNLENGRPESSRVHTAKVRQAQPVPGKGEQSDAKSVASKNRLREMLEAYREWYANLKKESAGEARFTMDDPMEAGLKLLEGARRLIFEDPKTFLDFIREPANEELCEPLIDHALNRPEENSSGGIGFNRIKFGDFPDALKAGILALLREGTPRQKSPMMRFLSVVEGMPVEMEEQVDVLMRDTDPHVQAAALGAKTRIRQPMTDVAREQVRRVYESSPNTTVRTAAVDALSLSPSAPVQSWLVDRLSENRDPGLVGPLAGAAHRQFMLLSTTGVRLTPEDLNRYSSALASAAQARPDKTGFHWLMLAAIHLPVDRIAPVLQEVLPYAPDTQYKSAISRILEMIKTGETHSTRFVAELQKATSN